MYIETSSVGNNSTARLSSSLRQSAHYLGLCLVFYYHMYGNSVGALNVVLYTGATDTLLFSRSQDQGNKWQQASIHFTTYSAWQITFEAVSGHSYTGDIAIDDISFLPGSCPTQGKASFTLLITGMILDL
ncbi:MAM and LDL-receptor class A domain-containing protein 2 [Holothuria leucospilota]|uniref:MAM and LDL-receptor class A domain-containing protein 2 n=1 Tax=Holothuria leucospilota TaxID=206669 RepID=A0A9Q0YUI1_HOLLE|nr:MAM and LDL-receptor class A domain-containing protein 2 [Holothuria leucospilota]